MKPCLLLFIIALFCSCDPKRQPLPDTDYFPVLMKRDKLDQSIVFHAPVEMENPAKIFYKGNFILVSERFKGIHLIDNTDPKNPVNRGYIAIPGCIDMIMKDNVLYANNAVDMVAVDLSAIGTNNFKVLKRTRDVFSELPPPDGKEVPDKYKPANRPENTVLIAWEK